MQTETSSLVPGDIAGAMTTHMRRLLVSTYILTKDAKPLTEDDKAAVSDNLLPLYKEVVSSAESHMQLTDMNPMNNELSVPCFTLDMGVIGPLYEVACNCRDPVLRRKIIQLLRRRNRQEGLLNSMLYARAVKTIVAIEEHESVNVRTAGDIPACSRIFNTSLQLDTDRERFTITFVSRSDELDSLRQREVFV